jgi:RecB family exonuclease
MRVTRQAPAILWRRAMNVLPHCKADAQPKHPSRDNLSHCFWTNYGHPDAAKRRRQAYREEAAKLSGGSIHWPAVGICAQAAS